MILLWWVIKDVVNCNKFWFYKDIFCCVVWESGWKSMISVRLIVVKIKLFKVIKKGV